MGGLRRFYFLTNKRARLLTRHVVLVRSFKFFTCRPRARFARHVTERMALGQWSIFRAKSGPQKLTVAALFTDITEEAMKEKKLKSFFHKGMDIRELVAN